MSEFRSSEENIDPPTNPKFTVIDAWRLHNPDKRPPVLSSQEQAYVDWYDRHERERRKWDMENVTEERIHKWEELERDRRIEEVWRDQAQALEEWLNDHPELFIEIAQTFSSRHKTALPLSYDRSGLYWLAANIVFKRFGFGDERRIDVGDAVFNRLYELFQDPRGSLFNELPEERREELNSAFGQAMHEAHGKLVRAGVERIQQLEHYIAHSAKIILKGGRAVDPEVRKRQRAKKKAQLSSLDDNDATSSTPHDSSPWENESYLKSEEDPSPSSSKTPKEQISNQDTFHTAELSEFVRTLSDQQKAIFFPLLLNPHLTNKELAPNFNLTPQRIGQIRAEIEKAWRSR
jgi:hypothetical protein